MASKSDLVQFPSSTKSTFKALTTARVVFLVVAAAAPLASMIGNMPLAFAQADGVGMPLAFLVTMAVLLCFAAGYTAMSREIVSTGAFYTYIGQGLGKIPAIAAAYCAVLAYGSYTVGIGAAFGYFMTLLLGQVGVTVPWIPCAFGGIVLIGVMGYRSLDLSAKLLAFLMIAEFGVLAAFDVLALLHHGVAALPLRVWHIGSFWRLDFGGVLPFAVTSFIGFESAALYGEETTDPERSIPRATLISLVSIGVFYLITVWIMIGSAGIPDLQQLARAQGGNLLLTLAGQVGGSGLVTAMGAFFVTSVLATFLALHNASSRYVFALARDGLLPAPLARFHPVHHSPHSGSLLMTGVELVLVLGLGLVGISPYTGIAIAAIGLGTIGIVVMQIGCALAVPFFYRKKPGAGLWFTKILPALGALGLSVFLVLMLVNYQALTGSSSRLIALLPASLLVLAGFSVIYAVILRRRRPDLYARVASAQRRVVTARAAVKVANYQRRYCVVGAGPAGLIMARALRREGIPYDQFERHSDVGGIWDPANAGSPIYDSAHFISSKFLSYFYGFPMPADYPDYPSHRQILAYVRDFARAFGLYDPITFNTEVVRAEPVAGGAGAQGWEVTLSTGETRHYAGVIAVPGVTWHANAPHWPGMEEFAHPIRHTVSYRESAELKGRRVLVVGCGNSGADIACDAARSADAAFISLRRGYRFVPKHMFGIPTDVLFSGTVMPPRGVAISGDVNEILDTLNGDLTRLGLPKPDHDALASHPIMNTEILNRLAHGDIIAKPDIARFTRDTVIFTDGSEAEIDLVLLATGYDYRLPFIDPALFEWHQGRPQLYLGMVHRTLDSLYVLGFVEFADAGYRRFDDMAQYIVADIHAHETGIHRERLQRRRENDFPDLRGGKTYVDSPRHANYVHSETYRNVLAERLRDLGWPDLTDQSFDNLRQHRAPQPVASRKQALVDS